MDNTPALVHDTRSSFLIGNDGQQTTDDRSIPARRRPSSFVRRQEPTTDFPKAALANSPRRPLVSVLTPVYNGAPYLADCIESVLAQNYPHWEYVILDNHSRDDSAAIARSYAARDPRIRLHTTPRHLPMLQSWNMAMRQIAPESAYCKVVHADDMLFPGCLEQMVAMAEAHPAVGVVGAYRLYGNMVDLDGIPYPSPLTPGRTICRQVLLEGIHIFGSPTSTLIRAELVRLRDPFYNEANPHADTEACFDLLRGSDWGFVHQVLTYTRDHSDRNTSAAQRLNSHLVGNLITLLRYGQCYLEPAEYAALLARALHQYDRHLARHALRGADAAFWEFHRAASARLSYPLTRGRIIRSVADLIAEQIANRLRLGETYRRLIWPARARATRRLRNAEYL